MVTYFIFLVQVFQREFFVRLFSHKTHYWLISKSDKIIQPKNLTEKFPVEMNLAFVWKTLDNY